MVFALLAGHFHPRRNEIGSPVCPLPLLPARVLRFRRLDHRVILLFLSLGIFLCPDLLDSSGLLFAVGGRNSGDDIAFRQNGLAPIEPDSEISDKNSLAGLGSNGPKLSAFAGQVPLPFHGYDAGGNSIYREDSAFTSGHAAPSRSQLHFLCRRLLNRGDNPEEVWGADYRREVAKAYRCSKVAVASVVRHHERSIWPDAVCACARSPRARGTRSLRMRAARGLHAQPGPVVYTTGLAVERLAALEECRDLGQGFQLAERDMGIRGFGNIFGEQQTGDIGNVGIDLFFEMLFESLSKVEEHRLQSVPYRNVQLDINITAHHSSEYINYLENPLELINEAEKAAEKGIWQLMQFTEDFRRQYGKEPESMEILLKKLYVRRMAADLGIGKIYALGKIVCMRTDISKKVFRIMTESMASDIHRNCLLFEENEIKAELLLELPTEQLLNWIFQCLGELYASLPALVKY
ncbi:hypothetical protein Taro_006780 [Colocasia esculenta]|uniref:Uncharacterized protein n=1 Tax=Colocasia esculenta TaxID=4460 RepID=A0A843TYP3_COLES|nr:hypothetical protein [Colocasia esculenta]